MAAEAVVKIDLEITELGNTVGARINFTDANTPANFTKGHTAVSNEVLFSVASNIASSVLRGLFMAAQGDGAFCVNTASTNISTQGQYVAVSQGVYMSFLSCTGNVGLVAVAGSALVRFLAWK